MVRCLNCKRTIQSGSLCSHCYHEFQRSEEQFQQKRGAIESRARLTKSKLKRNIAEPPDSVRFPLDLFPQDKQNLEKEINRQRQRELAQLSQRHRKLSPDPDDKSFDEYEKWLREHGGDHRLWHNIHGTEPKSLRTEFVCFDGRLKHDSTICPRCGKSKVNKYGCSCSQQTTDEPYNFRYGSR